MLAAVAVLSCLALVGVVALMGALISEDSRQREPRAPEAAFAGVKGANDHAEGFSSAIGVLPAEPELVTTYAHVHDEARVYEPEPDVPTHDVPKRDPAVAWTTRERISVAIAAGIPAALYLLYVSHYAVNVPFYDDWNMLPLVHSAIHGHVAMHDLWSEYVELRQPVLRIFFIAFGVFDRMNLRHMQLLSAVTLIASFALALLLFRSYLGRRLTFFATLSVGVVWFSLAEVQNAFFAVQLAWFSAVFGFIATAYLLLVPRRHRNLYFGLAIAAAVAGSLCVLQGFLAWPAGLICLLWARHWTRRTYYEAGAWVGAALLTTAIYLIGFTYGSGSCVVEGGKPENCSLSHGLHHPDQLARFFALLAGNVIPAGVWQTEPRYLHAQELLGTAILVAAVFVVVRSIRERDQAGPWPLLLIGFGMLSDLMVASSHLGQGLLIAGNSRFTSPNLLLVAGIVMYAWRHLPDPARGDKPIDRSERLRSVAFAALVAFLVVQGVLTTRFGIDAGQDSRAQQTSAARIAVNLDRIPSELRSCFEFRAGFDFPGNMTLNYPLAVADRLTMFAPGTAAKYRAQGPPVQRHCTESSHPTG